MLSVKQERKTLRSDVEIVVVKQSPGQARGVG